ncbi:MAG: MFS transporter [Flavobacteriales bacterium]|nr:MFS transporter [Flavobacteriales bacterium]MBT5749623.1 MFS transporter [Flavobacteriales bacterium]
MQNKQAITLLFLANIISGLAQGISMVAIPWYFVKVVSRPEVFASAYIIITFLTLFWGLYAGSLIDRYSRKHLFITINMVCGLCIGSIALYGFHAAHLTDFFVILVFGITIFNYNVHYPNLYAFGQEITEPKNYGKLNSYIEVQGQTTSVLAGAFAALLLTGTQNNVLEIAGFFFVLPFDIKAWKIYEIFLLDAFTYISVIFIFLMMKYKPITKDVLQKGSLFSRLKGGVLYLKEKPIIFIFGFLSYMLFAFTLVEVHVLLPSYVHQFLKMDGNVYASAEIYYSIGAILSGVLVLRVFKKLNTVTSIVLLLIVVSVAFYAMAIYNVLWVFFLGNLILGIANSGVRILRTTYLFNHVPNNLIGRANSVFSSLNIVVRMLMIGAFTLPFFNTNDNIRYGYFIGVGLMFLTLIPLLFWYKRITSTERN